MGISMIVDLASRLKERDAVSTHSASGRRGGVPTRKHAHMHTHTNSVIGREMQRGPIQHMRPSK